MSKDFQVKSSADATSNFKQSSIIQSIAKDDLKLKTSNDRYFDSKYGLESFEIDQENTPNIHFDNSYNIRKRDNSRRNKMRKGEKSYLFIYLVNLLIFIEYRFKT